MRLSRSLSSLGGAAVTLWTAGGWLRAQLYRSGVLRQRRLRGKVISIGNITWGGTGKTPFTLWLASRFQAAGLRVSILTRGYGRISPEDVKILAPGTSPLEAQGFGDEVQLYLRHLNVPIGIAAKRYTAGRLLEQQYPVDVHLLDDGFQHMGLARDLDLVLIDTTNPWGSRPGFASLLREAPEALRRAHAILLTRYELAAAIKDGPQRLEQLQTTLHELNPTAPRFTARTRLLQFTARQEKFSVSPAQMRARRPAAFCGLGNPDNYFRMLPLEGIRPVVGKTFPDHHRYQQEDLQLLDRLVKDHGADCLITTEKDFVNLPEAADFSVSLYWAEIEMVVDQEVALLRWVGEKLRLPLERPPVGASAANPSRVRSVAAIL